MMKMKKNRTFNKKKTLLLILILFLFFTSASICKATFNVAPRELSITMEDDFINGNTSQIITVNNPGENSTNISWYIDHPEPISSMRPDKTTIPDLSWINVEPQWQIIPPDESATFYIYLDIPEDKEYFNQNWESWITFKREKQEFINIEVAVRLYIDTPLELITDNDQDSGATSISIGEQIMLPFFYVLVVIVLLLVLFIGMKYVKKKK